MTTKTDANPRSGHQLLNGTWVNQLGSEVTFSIDPLGGIRGDYCGAAGALAGRGHPLVGSYQRDPVGHAIPVAFLVNWTEAHCVTTWCGHFLPDRDEIRTSWLMSTESEPGEEWKATVLGHDVFRRLPDR